MCETVCMHSIHANTCVSTSIFLYMHMYVCTHMFSICWKDLEAITPYQQWTDLALGSSSLTPFSIKGTRAPQRNGRFQDWGRQIRSWAWDTLLGQKVRRCSKKQKMNNESMSQGHRNKPEEAPAGQIWNNLNTKIIKDINGWWNIEKIEFHKTVWC